MWVPLGGGVKPERIIMRQDPEDKAKNGGVLILQPDRNSSRYHRSVK